MKVTLPGIIYEVTTKCNLNCKYCYNHWKRNGKRCIEESERINPEKTLKKLFKMARIPLITFSGGEPTLEKELQDLIILAKIHNKRVTLITNGLLLNDELIQQYLKLTVDLFELTINSYDKNVHNNLVGVEGAWEKTVNTVKTLIKYKANVVAVIVITKFNYAHIKETLDFVYELGIKTIMINRYNIGGQGVNNPREILLGKDELVDTFTKANIFAREKDIVLNSLVCTPVCLLNPKQYSNIKFSHCHPDYLNRLYTLNRNGDLRYCNHSPIIAGNIYQQHLNEILSSDYLKSWQMIIPEFCRECNSYNECFAGCRAASEQMGLGLSEADPILKYS